VIYHKLIVDLQATHVSSHYFMEITGSLTRSQKSQLWSIKPEPDKSTPYRSILFPSSGNLFHCIHLNPFLHWNKACVESRIISILPQEWILSVKKRSPYRPETGLLGSKRFKLSECLDNWHMEVARLSAQCTGSIYPPGGNLVPVSFRGWVNLTAIVWPEVLSQWKIPMTPSGIKPATFRLAFD